jgi:hypothetical protein
MILTNALWKINAQDNMTLLTQHGVKDVDALEVAVSVVNMDNPLRLQIAVLLIVELLSMTEPIMIELMLKCSISVVVDIAKTM